MSFKNIAIWVVTAILVVALIYFFNTAPKVSEDLTNMTPSPSSSITQQAASPSASLKIEDIKVGEGKEAKKGDVVKMDYLGTLENGTKFDSSYDRGTPFETQIGVGQVIKGWDEGVPGMKIGGKRKLIIPPDMAYGNRSIGNIPANSTLIFEVELLGIK